jgi:hypothetical protein
MVARSRVVHLLGEEFAGLSVRSGVFLFPVANGMFTALFHCRLFYKTSAYLLVSQNSVFENYCSCFYATGLEVRIFCSSDRKSIWLLIKAEVFGPKLSSPIAHGDPAGLV